MLERLSGSSGSEELPEACEALAALLLPAVSGSLLLELLPVLSELLPVLPELLPVLPEPDPVSDSALEDAPSCSPVPEAESLEEAAVCWLEEELDAEDAPSSSEGVEAEELAGSDPEALLDAGGCGAASTVILMVLLVTLLSL